MPTLTRHRMGTNIREPVQKSRPKEWLFTSGNDLFYNQYKFYFNYTLSFELVFVYESYRSSESEASFIQHSIKHHYSIMLEPDPANGMKQCIYIPLRNFFYCNIVKKHFIVSQHHH